jgi:hypothetical protein
MKLNKFLFFYKLFYDVMLIHFKKHLKLNKIFFKKKLKSYNFNLLLLYWMNN